MVSDAVQVVLNMSLSALQEATEQRIVEVCRSIQATLMALAGGVDARKLCAGGVDARKLVLQAWVSIRLADVACPEGLIGGLYPGGTPIFHLEAPRGDLANPCHQ